MRYRSTLTLVATLVLPGLLIGACRQSTAPTLERPELAVVGRVTDMQGQPVPGATLTFSVRRGFCIAAPVAFTPPTALTDAAGRVDLRLQAEPGPAFTGCVYVDIVPPADQVLLTGMGIIATNQRFAPAHGGAPSDTLRFDIALQGASMTIIPRPR